MSLRERRAEQMFFTLWEREESSRAYVISLRERRAEQMFFTLREREESSRAYVISLHFT